MKTRQAIAAGCALALLAPMPAATAQNASPIPEREQSGQGFCRTPEALPRLGPERQYDPQQPVAELRRSGAVRAMPEVASVPPPPPAPPPPPPPPPPMAASGADYPAAAEASVDSAVPGRVSSPPGTVIGPVPPMPPRPQPYPQSGILTAGEHDDLLNPELYAAYVQRSDLGQAVRDLPVLDTARLLTVELRDRRGQAMPFENVELRCADGNTITLRTVADGSVVFFPELDRLSERLWVRAGGEDWREVRLAAGEGGQTLRITSERPAQMVTKLDLNLVVDVTGSMSDELRYLQAELTTIVDALAQRHRGLDIRVGFTFYRDQTDAFVTQTHGLDRDMRRALRVLASHNAGGGGDYPEAMQEALIRAAGQDWRDDAVKTLLLVADAPPHDQDVGLTWLAAEHLRAERVHIVPVGASGVADLAEYVMRAMAASTQSRYTFLTDDSGVGNPHAEPAIDCYLVTRLDQLLRRVIDSQLSGRRIEPDAREVIRTVGQYDAGRCILPPGFGGKPQ